MNNLSFGVLVDVNASFEEIRRRCRTVEKLGFDQLWLPDHSSDYRNVGGPWLDGWTALAAAALDTTAIRIGTLVTNPILRSPNLVAREAHAIDHLSGGRLELGIGTGIARFDHDAMGAPYWPPRERARRFAEYVRLVDELLSGRGAPVTFRGDFYAADGASPAPPTPQQPRPPITVGGQSPTVLRTAAERADCWNTHGPFGATGEEILEVTARQNRQLDEALARNGRRPGALRRSLLLMGPLEAWSDLGGFERVVTRFVDVGTHEFVLFWPPPARLQLLERIALDAIPRMRAGPVAA